MSASFSSGGSSLQIDRLGSAHLQLGIQGHADRSGRSPRPDDHARAKRTLVRRVIWRAAPSAGSTGRPLESKRLTSTSADIERSGGDGWHGRDDAEHVWPSSSPSPARFPANVEERGSRAGPARSLMKASGRADVRRGRLAGAAWAGQQDRWRAGAREKDKEDRLGWGTGNTERPTHQGEVRRPSLLVGALRTSASGRIAADVAPRLAGECLVIARDDAGRGARILFWITTDPERGTGSVLARSCAHAMWRVMLGRRICPEDRCEVERG
ncbi:uncharacterized protein BXZ73DRAFT_80909 [Epithele typhae]|uniref:uncharacterized protein n=1 Tax=Epithele typhae TaxID=378194 RepID=UPI0020075713|nr:uncharacterized protein BXZ73DRAFT_80909 [Epithele typhae]KAH9917154.1 hypothetical protein BXZ73DRAFT_80909 [Epithele typhae]